MTAPGLAGSTLCSRTRTSPRAPNCRSVPYSADERSGASKRASGSVLANLAKNARFKGMTTMNVSLPAELKAFVDAQVERGGYGSTSEFVRDLIRREQDRQALRALLLDGASSPAGPIADQSYFSALRARTRSTD